METNNQISVLVCNYNSPLNKILLTIESCILQADIDLEIIYCDDASKNNYKQEVEQYFKDKGFKNYKFSLNNKNVGTVKNIYKGLSLVQYEYVKVIGCGDLFYDAETCYKMINHMKNNNSTIAFCDAVYFFDDGQTIKTFNLNNPMNLKPYIDKNINKIRKSLIINKDFILGASIFVKKCIYEKFLERALDKVIYSEDLCIYGSVIEDNAISYYDKYGIYYEYSTGISTKSDFLKKELENDLNNSMEIIYNYHKSKLTKKALDLIKISSNGNNKIKKFMRDPSIILRHLNVTKIIKAIPEYDFYSKCKESVECNTK